MLLKAPVGIAIQVSKIHSLTLMRPGVMTLAFERLGGLKTKPSSRGVLWVFPDPEKWADAVQQGLILRHLYGRE